MSRQPSDYATRPIRRVNGEKKCDIAKSVIDKGCISDDCRINCNVLKSYGFNKEK